MKTSWRQFFRRVASVTMVGGATMMTSAMNYAMAQIASDSGSNAAYSDNWQGQSGYSGATEDPFSYSGYDNGGFGFQPWTFSYDYNAPGVNGSNHFINSLGGGNANFAPGNPFSSAFNDLGSNAFVLSNAGFGFNGNYAATEAVRPFSSPLNIGNTFSIDLDNPMLPSSPPNPSGGDGFVVSLRSGFTERVGLFAQTNFAGAFWSLAGVGAVLDSDLTSVGSTLSVTLTSPTTYDLSLKSLSGSTLYSISGATLQGSGAIDNIRLSRYSINQTTNGRNEFYFDNLSIVPEPGSAALLLVGVGGALLGRCRSQTRQEA